MRRFSTMILVASVVFIGVVGAGLLQDVIAQEGTPAAEETGLPDGVVWETVAAGRAEVVPPGPAIFEIFRLRFEPGAQLEIPADDPTLAIPVMETGALTYRLSAPVTIVRAVPMGTPGAQGRPEEMAAETEFTLNPGDSFVGPPNAGGVLRNDGAEPAVALIAHIIPLAE